MADADLDQSLLSLESEAKRLTQASSKTNLVIQKVQLRLKALNIGLEYWLADKPLVVGPANGRVSLWLGYTKLENEWQLAVKVPASNAGFLSKPESAPTPLLKTTREIRQEALAFLPDLIEGLKILVAKKADELESAARRFAQ